MQSSCKGLSVRLDDRRINRCGSIVYVIQASAQYLLDTTYSVHGHNVHQHFLLETGVSLAPSAVSHTHNLRQRYPSQGSLYCTTVGLMKYHNTGIYSTSGTAMHFADQQTQKGVMACAMAVHVAKIRC